MKKITTSLFSLFICLLLAACDDEDIGSDVISIVINATVESKDGEDLLYPSNPNSYSVRDMRLLYEKEGQLVTEDNGTENTPRGIMLAPPNSTIRDYYLIRIFPPEYVITEINPGEIKIFTNYIKWTENDLDTLEYEVNHESSNAIVTTKVWYNGIMADFMSDVARTIKVVK